MAITFIGSVETAATSLAPNTDFNINISDIGHQSGDYAIICTGVADDAGNAMLIAPNPALPFLCNSTAVGNPDKAFACFGTVLSAGVTTITLQHSAAQANQHALIGVFRGIDTSNPLDQPASTASYVVHGQNDRLSATGREIITSASGSMILRYCFWNGVQSSIGTHNVIAGYTQMAYHQRAGNAMGHAQFRITTSEAVTDSANFSTTGGSGTTQDWSTMVLSFRAAGLDEGGGGATTILRHMQQYHG